jgi:phosphatidate cytidylyltransferase
LKLRGWRVLKERVITAVILIGLFLGVLYYLPANYFSAVISLLVIAGAWEWSLLAGISHRIGRWLYSLAAVLLMMLANDYVIAGSAAVAEQFLMSACLWWLVSFAWVVRYPRSAELWGNVWTKAIMGWLILVPMWVAIVLLINTDSGANTVLFVVLVVVLADTGGYVGGRLFGKNKLAPAVSPGKTWEGLYGGLVANLIWVAIFAFYNELSTSELAFLAAAVLVTALFSVLGDLTESMIKRHSNIKDSGNILPGHGGIMDRLDGMSAALPVFALIYLLTH